VADGRRWRRRKAGGGLTGRRAPVALLVRYRRLVQGHRRRLIAHGLVKVLLAVGLLRDYKAAYPLAIVTLGALATYQL